MYGYMGTERERETWAQTGWRAKKKKAVRRMRRKKSEGMALLGLERNSMVRISRSSSSLWSREKRVRDADGNCNSALSSLSFFRWNWNAELFPSLLFEEIARPKEGDPVEISTRWSRKTSGNKINRAVVMAMVKWHPRFWVNGFFEYRYLT